MRADVSAQPKLQHHRPPAGTGLAGKVADAFALVGAAEAAKRGCHGGQLRLALLGAFNLCKGRISPQD